jgi:hypothetical protein
MANASLHSITSIAVIFKPAVFKATSRVPLAARQDARGPVLRQGQRDGFADPAAGAVDEGDFALERKGYQHLPPAQK